MKPLHIGALAILICTLVVAQAQNDPLAKNTEEARLQQCASLQAKLDHDILMTDDEIAALKNCVAVIPTCAGKLCEAYVPKRYDLLTRPGDIGSDWQSLYPG